MRRFTRLTNGFSKKVENHAAAVALYFMYYNFARIHQTLRTSPAQAAGVTEKLWEIEDIVSLLGHSGVGDRAERFRAGKIAHETKNNRQHVPRLSGRKNLVLPVSC